MKWPRDISLAEVISKVTGQVWDRSHEESSEDEGDGTRAYLGAQFFLGGGEAVESLGSVVIQPTHTSALDGKDK